MLPTVVSLPPVVCITMDFSLPKNNFCNNIQAGEAVYWKRHYLWGAAEIYAPGNLSNNTFLNATVKTVIKDMLEFARRIKWWKGKISYELILSSTIRKHWNLMCEFMGQGESTSPPWVTFPIGDKLFCFQPSIELAA